MSDQNTATMTNPEAIADLTDQTLADDSAEDVLLAGETEGDIATLRAALEETAARADAEREAHLRALADFANYKRRNEEEKQNLREYLSADLLTRLLPLADNFERALHAATQTNDYEKLVGGVNAVYRQLSELLAREGVQPIEALYQPFDPNIHNAVLREETTEYPENTVVEELQKGYTLKDRVLRPTMVKVAIGDS